MFIVKKEDFNFSPYMKSTTYESKNNEISYSRKLQKVYKKIMDDKLFNNEYVNIEDYFYAFKQIDKLSKTITVFPKTIITKDDKVSGYVRDSINGILMPYLMPNTTSIEDYVHYLKTLINEIKYLVERGILPYGINLNHIIVTFNKEIKILYPDCYQFEYYNLEEKEMIQLILPEINKGVFQKLNLNLIEENIPKELERSFEIVFKDAMGVPYQFIDKMVNYYTNLYQKEIITLGDLNRALVRKR